MLFIYNKAIYAKIDTDLIMLQDHTGGYMNALTIYVISCMIFISFAMVYYGYLLYVIRKKENEESLSLFMLDKTMLILYELAFILFNAIYFTALLV